MTPYIATKECEYDTKRCMLHLLPSFVDVKVEAKGNSKACYIYCSIWVNKKVQIGPDYSTEFKDWEILEEQARAILAKFDINVYKIDWMNR